MAGAVLAQVLETNLVLKSSKDSVSPAVCGTRYGSEYTEEKKHRRGKGKEKPRRGGGREKDGEKRILRGKEGERARGREANRVVDD